MNAPKISVVTVCFNSAATIERTIESVAAQSWPDLEYIVIDGGSTDGTLDVIRKHTARIAHWQSEPDRGAYDAMNKGIARATGEWIHILNSDDRYVDADALARVIPHLDPGRTNYYAMIRENERGERRLVDFPFRAWKLQYAAFVPHPAMIVGRDQYARIGGYDANFRIAADHELTMRMLKTYPAKRIDAVLTVMHDGGLSGRQMLTVAREFRQAAIQTGQPRWLAWLLYGVKRLHWRV